MKKILTIFLLYICWPSLYGQQRDTTLLGGTLKEASITSDKHRSITTTPLTLKPLDIRRFPALFSEVDPLKIILFTPGIQNNNEGDVSISIRGGDTDQSLISLDNIPLYNPSHLNGFISVINADLLSGTDIYKGGFPAKFGNRLSGVIDMKTKNGDMKGYHGTATIGIMSSKALFEGPIIKDKLSFVVTGRASYLGAIVLPIYRKISESETNFVSQFDGSNYYDYHAKLLYTPSDEERISLTFIGGDDKVSIGNIGNGSSVKERYGNIGANLGWDREITNTQKITTFGYYSRYMHRYSSGNNKNNSFSQRNSGIEEVSLGGDYSDISIEKMHLSAGIKYSYQLFSPQIISSQGDSLKNTIGEHSDLHTLTAYVEDEYSPTDILKLALGVRLSLYTNKHKTKFVPEPRFRASYLPIKELSLNLSYSAMSQGVNLLSSGNITAPADIWLGMSGYIDPSSSHNATFGISYEPVIGGNNYHISTEGYFKTMKNILDYKDGISTLEATTFDEMVEMGKGYAYGVEFLAQKNTGSLTGSIAYTWSKALNQFETINSGNWYYSSNDCRHNLALYLTQKFGDKFDITLSFNYKTGKHITIMDILVLSGEPPTPTWNYDFYMWISQYSERNKYRLEDYHRMDISANYYIDGKFGKHTLNFSIYNLYNHQNPYLVFAENNDDVFSLKKLCIFPFMPSISYSFEF